MPEPRLYTLLDLVGRLRLSESTIRRMVKAKRFPQPCYPVEGTPRWTEEQVGAYLRAVEMGLIPPLPRRRRKRRQEESGPSQATPAGPRPSKKPPREEA